MNRVLFKFDLGPKKLEAFHQEPASVETPQRDWKQKMYLAVSSRGQDTNQQDSKHPAELHSNQTLLTEVASVVL